MADMRRIVVLKPVRGIRPGTVVDVASDDAMWASKVVAGSAAYLDSVDDVDVVDDDDLGEEE